MPNLPRQVHGQGRDRAHDAHHIRQGGDERRPALPPRGRPRRHKYYVGFLYVIYYVSRSHPACYCMSDHLFDEYDGQQRRDNDRYFAANMTRFGVMTPLRLSQMYEHVCEMYQYDRYAASKNLSPSFYSTICVWRVPKPTVVIVFSCCAISY